MKDIKFGEKFIPLEHVYCTNCKNGKNLIETIYNDLSIPKECGGCYPYGPEDSKSLYLRRNYKEEIDFKENMIFALENIIDYLKDENTKLLNSSVIGIAFELIELPSINIYPINANSGVRNIDINLKTFNQKERNIDEVLKNQNKE
jgi:antitoxin component HigA of HigAB toxin-antitoxin module